MKEIKINQLVEIFGGDLVDGYCDGWAPVVIGCLLGGAGFAYGLTTWALCKYAR